MMKAPISMDRREKYQIRTQNGSDIGYQKNIRYFHRIFRHQNMIRYWHSMEAYPITKSIMLPVVADFKQL